MPNAERLNMVDPVIVGMAAAAVPMILIVYLNIRVTPEERVAYAEHKASLKCICGDRCWTDGYLLFPSGCHNACEYCNDYGIGPHPKDKRAKPQHGMLD